MITLCRGKNGFISNFELATWKPSNEFITLWARIVFSLIMCDLKTISLQLFIYLAHPNFCITLWGLCLKEQFILSSPSVHWSWARYPAPFGLLFVTGQPISQYFLQCANRAFEKAGVNHVCYQFLSCANLFKAFVQAFIKNWCRLSMQMFLVLSILPTKWPSGFPFEKINIQTELKTVMIWWDRQTDIATARLSRPRADSVK